MEERERERETCWTWNDLRPVSLTRPLSLERHERDTSWANRTLQLSRTLLLVFVVFPTALQITKWLCAGSDRMGGSRAWSRPRQRRQEQCSTILSLQTTCPPHRHQPRRQRQPLLKLLLRPKLFRLLAVSRSLASSSPYSVVSSSAPVSFSRRRVCCARRPGTQQARVLLT